MRATINGASLYVEDTGARTAPAVVFVHGFPFSSEIWAPQVRALSASCRTIVYDVRGHGQSDIGDGQYTIESHVDDLVGLLDHLGVTRAAVAGLSMGGYITLRALERNPERFLAAILCDTRSEADTNETKLRRAAGIAAVKRNGSAAYADDFVSSVFSPATFRAHPEIVETIRRIIARTPPLSIAGTLLALASRTDTTGSLSSVRVPTLILVGEDDTITPPAVARALHERIPGSELHVIPHAGHLSCLENPAPFNEFLTSFLDRVFHPR